MKKPVQRLDPVAVFVAALIGAVWVQALQQAAADSVSFEVGPSLDEELHIVRAHNKFGRDALQRQIDAAAERDARGEHPKETP